jgi:hypothetical protein
MTTELCDLPLIVHRQSGIFECADSGCSAGLEGHSQQVPCQWSWPYAHGRAYLGRPFPHTRCTQCRHIRRAGRPEIEIISEMRESG